MSDIYTIIKKISKNKKISIAKLEEKSKLSNGSISKWNKSTPSIKNLKKVADYFGVTLDSLISDSQEVR